MSSDRDYLSTALDTFPSVPSELHHCWRFLIDATAVGWLTVALLEDLTYCLRTRVDFGVQELLFDFIDGRLRVAFLDDEIFCDAEQLIQCLLQFLDSNRDRLQVHGSC
jgi:hypothetical protein